MNILHWFKWAVGLIEVSTKEYETLCSRCVDLEQRLRNLELTHKDLLDKVLRKIQRKEEAVVNRRFPFSRTSPPSGGSNA